MGHQLGEVEPPAVPDSGLALRAFTAATEADPDHADAWLGRAAAGDRHPAVFAALGRVADGVGVAARRLGLGPDALAVSFSTGLYVDYPLRDPVTARVGFAAQLIAEDAIPDALAVLDEVDPCPIERYQRAVAQLRARAWPDVLTALDGAGGWSDEYLRCAAQTVAGAAAAQLGQFARALALLRAGQAGPVPAAASAATFTRALVLRERGEEAAATALLSGLDHPQAAAALAAPGFRLRIEAPGTIGPAAREAPAAPDSSELLARATAELDRQIGLTEVKSQVNRLRSTAELARLRSRRGLATGARSLHLVFTGPPGTGKTTIARIVARIYHALGLLPSSTVVEVGRRDLVGEHLGATAIRTGAVIDSALGGVLFIDEAYALIEKGLSGGDAFGREAVDTLLTRMENERDNLVVIIAGYEAEIDRFLGANEGLASRFARRIRFDSYSAEELSEIGSALAKSRDSQLTADAVAVLRSGCEALAPRIDALGNGRFVRNVIEAAEEERELRLAERDPDSIDDAALMRIEAGDLARGLDLLRPTDG